MPNLPLEDVRVLDLSRVLAGPLCAQYLGDMGADVIKVEDPAGGDDTRKWPEFVRGPGGARSSAVFASANRNKRSIALDLKMPAGRDVVHALAARADVVIESFGPGVAARLGVDAGTLRAINPRLIHCAISGFGSVGPLRNGKGYDLILQAFSGMLLLAGEDGGPPTRSAFSPVDQATGLHALIGILAALYERRATGRGHSVEAALFDTSAAFLGYYLHNHWQSGAEPGRVGVGHTGLCPYGLFDTADRPVIVGVANDVLWGRFCQLTGLDTSAWPTNAQRVQHRAAVEAQVQAALRQRGRAHWFAVLDEAGIPCSPLHTLGEFAAHPHTTASGMVVEVDDPHFGTQKAVAQPIRLDGQRMPQRRPPPLLGEHTLQILAELGMAPESISAWIANDVIAPATQI